MKAGHCASLCPPLYGLGRVKRQSVQRTATAWLQTPYQFLCSTDGRFFVPTTRVRERRAEPRSRLAAGHRRRRREAALTAASTTRCWRCRDEGWRVWRQGDPGLGRERAMRQRPHHLVSGRVRKPGTLIFHAWVKARPRRDGTHLRSGVVRTLGWVRSHVCPRSPRPS